MRFIPLTFMQSGDFCVEATASNGVISGSFTSGSETYNYYEFGSGSSRDSNQSYQFEITSGYTNRARLIVIGGGGGGGWDGLFSYGNKGGGGGAGAVLVNNEGTLYPATYSITKGRGGDFADADAPSNPTFDGGNGGYSQIDGGAYTLSDKIRANGGEGGFGDSSNPGTYGHGGDSGQPFNGAADNANGSGGGGGAASDGFQAASDTTGGLGGTGKSIVLGYTSPTLGVSTIQVGGGGVGIGGTKQGLGQYGGGTGADNNSPADSGDRHTGGGGGGGADFPYTPPNGQGTQGGDGLVIIMFPTGSCS